MARFSLKNALQQIDHRNAMSRAERALDLEGKREALKARVDPMSADQRLARAKQNEQSMYEQIELLKTLPQNDPVRAARMKIATARLGELYAEQGRYEEAIEVTQDADLREKYRSVLKAIDQPDGAQCECRNTVAMTREGQVPISVRFPVKEVYSRKHGRLVMIEQCVACGFRQAK